MAAGCGVFRALIAGGGHPRRVRRPLPDDLVSRPFAVHDAVARGVTPKRLMSSDLAAPFWGVRDPGLHENSLHSLVAARAVRLPPGMFFSHRTAAQLWSIPLPRRLDSTLPLHIASDAPRRGPTGRGTIGHHVHIDRRDLRSRTGVTITSLERTVFDLAGQLDDEELLGALDNILWRRRALEERATPETIRDALSRFRGRRGRGRLLSLIPFATDRSDSIPESAFRLRFHRAGLPPARPNEPIVDARGRFVALPDLRFDHYLMCFDYEGDHHRTDPHQWQRDLARVPRLQDLGWHHTRLSAADLARPDECLARTVRLLRERGWRP